MWISSLVKFLFESFAHILIGLFVIDLQKFFIYSGHVFCQIYTWIYVSEVSSASMWLTFLLYDVFFFSVLVKSSISIFSLGVFLSVLFKQYLPISGSWKYSPMLSSRRYIALPFTFRLMIHIELSLCVMRWGQKSFFPYEYPSIDLAPFPFYWNGHPYPTSSLSQIK